MASADNGGGRDGAGVSAATRPTPSLRLIYFNIGGKGEPLRVLAHYLGVPLDDDRIGVAPAADCATPKDDKFLRYHEPAGERWAALKASGACPFGQLPLLVVNGGEHVLTQSGALMRYLGRTREGQQRGVYPADNPELLARIDALLDQEADMFAGCRVAKYTTRFGVALDDAQRDAVLKANVDEVVPRHLKAIDAHLANSATGWLCGTPTPTIADFFFACSIGSLPLGWPSEQFKDSLKPFPRIEAFLAKYVALDEVKSYYAPKQ
mmetsp:Transcript_6201/g.15048  ORF Transcript_6201/g.15048 Transcript_6201/m.15048 type:complete len:265 (-) Transcript_6201:114-908(-)